MEQCELYQRWSWSAPRRGPDQYDGNPTKESYKTQRKKSTRK